MTSSNVKYDIPSAYIPFIKCSVLEEDTMGNPMVTICTSNGQVLEFCDRKLINGCEIDCSDARNILHFISYNPFTKYYLVQTSSQVIVILRQKELKIYKIFEDIISVKVKDLMGLGRPQIVMETSGQDQPLVTDLVGMLETSECPKVQSQISLTLHSKLQEVSLRLVRAKNLLQEKRSCRTNAMFQFAEHIREKLSHHEEIGKITVLGPTVRRNEISTPKVLSKLQVSLPWQRIYCNKWIIGVHVFNSSLRKLHGIGLILNREEESTVRYRTYFFVFSQVNEPGLCWTEILPQPSLFHPDSDLPGNSSGAIICVMDEPTFQNSNSIKLSGVIVYKEEDNISAHLQQVLFSPVELRVSDLVQGRLKSFVSTTSNELDCDLLSCIVVCSCTKLEVVLIQPTQQSLEEKLEQNLGFIRLLSINYFVCKQSGALEDVIVKVNRSAPWQYILSVFTSEEKKTMLFVHSLHDILPQHARVNKIVEGSTSTIQDAVTSLNKELLLLLNTLSHSNKKELPLMDTSTIQLSQDSWTDLKDQLFKQELITDKLFNKLPVETFKFNNISF